MHFQNRRSNRAIIARRYFRLVEQARIDSIPAKPTMNPVASQFFGRAFKKPPNRALQEAASDLRLYKTVTCRGCVAATYITTCVYVCVYIYCIYISVCICICIYVDSSSTCRVCLLYTLWSIARYLSTATIARSIQVCVCVCVCVII